MLDEARHYAITLVLNRRCELQTAAVGLHEDGREREIIKMYTGPFDSPEEILATIIELIDHAEWHGEQLKLPETYWLR